MKRENEEAASRRADAADSRATAADMRATGADARATGADVRAGAADTRADAAIAAAHNRMIAELKPLEAKLDKSIKRKNRIIAALIAGIFLMAGIGYADLYGDRKARFKQCKERRATNAVIVRILNEAYALQPPDPVRRANTDRLIELVPKTVCETPSFWLWKRKTTTAQFVR